MSFVPRYYYTDPLAAAHMKRDHGFKILMRAHVSPYTLGNILV